MMKITDEQKERANFVNLPQFLVANGFDLKKVGREYVWKEHDSLHIKDNSPGERGAWYRFSEGKGGDNIQFLREYMGMAFAEAVEALTGEKIDRTFAPGYTYHREQIQQTAGEISLAKADNAKRVFAYLCKTRGLNYAMISALVKSGSISQEEKTGNVLFKYFDENGKIIGAEKVGTSTEHKFKGVATGSSSGHGFEICRGNGEKLYFFESAIDMLSYLQMHENELQNCRLVSMMGVKPNIVTETMNRYKISPENVFLCSDNDKAGNEFAERLRTEYPEMKRISTSDTYKDWNDMLRGIPKIIDKKEEKSMQLYGNKFWNNATDNRDKSLISIPVEDFRKMQENLEKSGINYYAYEIGDTVRLAVNDKDVDWLRSIFGNVEVTKSGKPYSPPEKNIIGNAEYRYIPQKEYVSGDRDLILKMADIMAKRDIKFSGRIYPSGKGTLTVSRNDLQKVREVQNEVINMRKQFANHGKSQEIGNREYHANRDTHYYMSKYTPEEFAEIKPFLDTSVSYHAVAHDGKIAFAVDKENAQMFHHALENACREKNLLHSIQDTGLEIEKITALSPVIHRLASDNLQINLTDFFDKRYDDAQFGEMLSLVNAYLDQSVAERYGEHSKLNEMLEAKSSFDRSIELSDFFSLHEFTDEQKSAISEMFVGDVTRTQIDSIDETFTIGEIQAYDELLHNALQESDVAEFLTAHRQAVAERENAEKQAYTPHEQPELNSEKESNEDREFLYSVQHLDDVWHFKVSEEKLDDVLKIAGEEKSFRKLMELGEPISIEEYAEIQQSDRFGQSIAVNFDDYTAKYYTVNDGKGGFSDGDRTDENTKFETVEIPRPNVSLDKSEQKESPIHFGLFGNGITAYDISRTDAQTNDYPVVAHISEEGVVKIYDNSISAEDMEQINEQAKSAREKFLNNWNMLSPEQKYQKLLNNADISTLSNINREKLSMEEKIEKYMPFVFFEEGERPEPEQPKNYKIYQLPDGEKYHGIRFESKEQLEKDGVQLNHEDYALVYEGKIADFKGISTLENLYTQFNSNRPKDFTGHSLSVSDVVVISDNGTETAYFCDKAGFTEMPEFFREKEIVQEKIAPKDSIDIPENKGTLALHKMGDFYEFYDDDAEKAADILGLHLMHRKNEDVVGFPDYVKDEYLEKLKNAGYTVVVIGDTDREFTTLQDVVDKFFGTDCEFAETADGTWKLSITDNEKVGELFYGGEPVCGIYNRGDKMEIEPYQEDTHIPEMLENAMLEHNPDKPVEIMDFQRTLETPLDRAKFLINEFCETEYHEGADFDDLHNVGLAFTTLTDDELLIQVTADLVDFKITYEFDGEVFKTEQYNSIENMIENGLTGLDFSDLVSVPDDVIDRHTADRTTIYIEASEEDIAELHEHLSMNGYDVKWSDDSKSFDTDGEQTAYIETILADRNIVYSLDGAAFDNPEQTVDLMSDVDDVEDIPTYDDIPEITLEYKGNAESIEEIRDAALSIGAIVTVSNSDGTISIQTYENHREELENLAQELDLTNIPEQETEDIDRPLFTDSSVIEEIQRNEDSDLPFWETPAIEGEQLSLFGDSEPVQAKKPEKPKSEFASGPVVDGVQVYEALANEIDRGTGFVDGKLRVQDFFEKNSPTTQQLVDFLKKEYGTGGHSGDGRISFVNHDGKGLTFLFENGEKFRHSWNNVATMVKARLDSDTYLTAEEKSKRQTLVEEKGENLPDRKNSVSVGDKFRNKLTGVVSEVVSLTGAMPFYTEDCTVKRPSGKFEITENIPYSELFNADRYEFIGKTELENAVPETKKTDVKKQDKFVPVYKGDWEIAENRTLYREIVGENRRFAEMAEKVIGNGLNPTDSVKALTEEFGFERTAWLTALNIAAHPLDGRFYPSDKKWASDIISPFLALKPDEMFANDTEKQNTFDRMISGGMLHGVHNTHLAQFAETLIPEYAKYLEKTVAEEHENLIGADDELRKIYHDGKTAFYCFTDQESQLNLDTLPLITEKSEQYVIAAGSCLLSNEFMQEHNITFLKYGRDLTYHEDADHMLQAMREAVSRVNERFTKVSDEDKQLIDAFPETFISEPVDTPWGKAQECLEIAKGVFEVSTAGHGGVMIREELAEHMLSPEALEIGFVENGYHCFEEDADAQVPLHELFDKGIVDIQQYVSEKYQKSYEEIGEWLNTVINDEISAFHPEYWQAHKNAEKSMETLTSSRPTITCEWSESDVFEDGKTYSVAEFDKIMMEADKAKVEGWQQGIEKYGSAKSWEEQDEESYYNFLGYDKTQFTVNMPDGTSFTERQDIGDGDGGVIDFLKSIGYSHEVDILEKDIVTHSEELLVNKPFSEEISTPDTAQDGAENTLVSQIIEKLNIHYDRIYQSRDNVDGYAEAVRLGDKFINENPDFMGKLVNQRQDFISSDRETAALAFALADLGVIERFTEKDTPEKGENFTITDDALGEGGAKAKFRANVDAIKILKTLEKENRNSTMGEKKILSRYVGWGALPQAFDKSADKWSAEYKELSELLTPQEYAQARSTVNDAFFTSPAIIDGIYEALGNFGFEGGNVLEPSCGVGNFFGRMPDEMQDNSQLYGVEIDSISGRIAQILYPDADIEIQGFEKNSFQNGSFDVAVGNVPFGELGFKDTVHGASKLHDYFFLEALDKLKNGGIMAFVTSAGTLDKRDESVRKMLADKADFIGAIRLPGGKNGAFKDNAGTEVTTDIIFLQKRSESPAELPEWVHIGETANGLPINKYFEQHPDMILGEVIRNTNPRGGETMVVAPDGFDLKSALHDAVGKLSAKISHEKGRDVYAKTNSGMKVKIPTELRNYSLFMSDDKVFFKKNNAACEFRFDKNNTQHKRFKAFIELRDITRELIEAMERGRPDSVVENLQAKLNKAYDDFYAKYGLIHSQTNKRYFSEDVSYNLVAGLEKKYDKTKLVEKSDIFTRRTIVPPKAVEHVDTALEALTLSVAEKARVDFEYMSKLTGMTEDELKNDLVGEIFKIPHTENTYQTASEYLSGDIRAKLREAEEIAEYDADFNINVSALKKAMPEPLKAGDIDVRIGATWIDPKYYEQFIYELLQTPKYQRNDRSSARQNRSAIIGVEYSEIANSFHVSNKSADKSVLATQKYGSYKMNAYDIFEHLLNLQEPKVYKTIEVPDGLGDTKEKRVIDDDATRVVQKKAENIKKAFKDWIFKDSTRRETIVNRYNELFNSIRPCEYDGSALSFPMMNADIQLHDHQKNAIAHALFGGNTLFAHSVGAGKTFEMIATAMESKRLGLCTKSLFAVPNHLTEQIGDDFQKLYPGANILVATKKDFQRANRQELFAKIATGNYDAVIIGHSQLGMIPVSKVRQIMTIQSQIDDILRGIETQRRLKIPNQSNGTYQKIFAETA